jgi:hypothetical protein
MAYEGMPEFPLFGDGSILTQYSYIVTPNAKRGSLLDFVN